MYWTAVWFLVLGAKAQAAESVTLDAQLRELLRNRIEAAGVPPRIEIGDRLIYSQDALSRFYERRTFEPAWSGDSGPLPVIEELLEAIGASREHGLRSSDYHLPEIEQRLEEIHRNQQRGLRLNRRRLVDLELLVTDAFLIYGSHLLAGRVNPETLDSEWHAVRRGADLASVLERSLETGDVREALRDLLPPQRGYGRLVRALAHYRNLAMDGGWPAVPEGETLRVGDRSERVRLVRRRLRVSGDLSGSSQEDEDIFDHSLAEAVERFQHRHGLEVDGVVGRASLEALNVPAAARERQIEINLERWRWLPQDLGSRHILVNIPSFELEVLEGDEPVLEMRAIVGRDYRRTPVFSDTMTYLVLSPYWHVPPRLAVQDKLPLIRKDPTYLEKQGMRVFQGWGAEAREIDPLAVDWSQLSASHFPFRLRQDPGLLNALGRIKFMFPNKYNVYLHDTPERRLFARAERSFSSGCIRIEKPIELAEYLLREDSRWNREKILAVVEKQDEQVVRLPTPLPVHLLYWTSWVSREGQVHFRKDIYGRDRRLERALKDEAPESVRFR